MATTQSPVAPTPDASDAFESAIWHNSQVCNRCFSRVRDIDVGTVVYGKNDHKRMQWEYRDRTTHATLDHDVEAKGETGTRAVRDDDGQVVGLEPIATHSAQYRETTRTTCLQCGAIGCRDTDETLSRREALQRVDELVARLREAGYPVSERHVRACVRRGKTRSDTQGYDREIFAAAAKVGVRNG